MAKSLKFYLGLVFLFCFSSIYHVEVWSDLPPPQDISSPEVFNRPSIGIDGAGNAVALWAQFDQAITINIQSADRPKGKNWTSPSTISSFEVTSPFIINNVGNQIAVNTSGDAVAAWVEINENDSNNNDVVAATRKANGSWTAKTLTTTANLFPRPAVAIDSNGNGVVIWVETNGISSSTFLASTGTWSNAQTVIQGSSNGFPQIGVDNSGHAVAIWFDSASNVVRSSFLSFLQPGATWSTSTQISNSNVDTASHNLSLATSGSSFTVAAWSTTDKKIEANTALFSNNGFIWGQNPQQIDSIQILGGVETSQLEVAIDPSNNAIAIWTNSTHAIQSSYLPSGSSTWNAVLTVSSSTLPAQNPRVAFDPSGNAWAVWDLGSSTATALRIIQNSVLVKGTTSWSSPVTLSDSTSDSFEPQIAVDPAGNEAIAWLNNVNNDGTTQRVQAVYLTQPVVISITPNQGPSSGGNQVTITGFRFNDVQSVTFGGVSATSFTVTSSTSISVTVPPSPDNKPNQVNVVVTTKIGSSSEIITYSYDPPSIRSISPNEGKPGFLVNINGQNFIPGATTLKFGMVEATETFVSNPELLLALVPKNPGQETVEVTVTTPGGTSNALQFKYQQGGIVNPPLVTTVTPNSGPAQGRNTVTITGFNFTNVSAVKFGNTDALQFKVKSSTSIKAKVPPGMKGSTVDVTVTTTDGTSPTSIFDQYTYKKAHPKPPRHFVGVLFRKNLFSKKPKYELEATWRPSSSPHVVEYRIYQKNKVVRTVRVDSSSSSSSGSDLFFETTVHSRKEAKEFSITAVNAQGVESKRVKLSIVRD